MYNLHEIFIFMALAVVWLIRVVLDSRDSIILDNCQGLSYFPCTPDHHSYWWWKSWYVRKISSCEETVCMNFKNKTSVYERGWGENYQMSCSYIHWRPLYCGNEHSKEGNKFFSSLRVKVNEETAMTIDHRPLFATFSLHSPPCLIWHIPIIVNHHFLLKHHHDKIIIMHGLPWSYIISLAN